MGALTTLVAVTAVLLIGGHLDELDVPELVDEPREYLATESIQVLLAVLATLVLSYISAGLIAAAIFVRPGKRSVRAGEAWYVKFEIDRPEGKAVAMSAELRDGRTVSGSLRSHSVGDSDRKDLAINGPIFVSFPGGPTVRTQYEFLLLEAEEIVSIAGSYVAGKKVEDSEKK